MALESWTYRDAPDYGSPELDLRNEETTSIAASRTQDFVHHAGVHRPAQVHPRQTARIYHLKLARRPCSSRRTGAARGVLHAEAFAAAK